MRFSPAVSSSLARYVPVLDWAPRYDRSWLTRDVIAGLTVWALVVPESLAYASIAGVPVQNGLYAVPLALIGYVIFGSCRQLFVGPSATVASISAVAVGAASTGSTGASQTIVLSAVLALMVGVIYILLGLARMGWRSARSSSSPPSAKPSLRRASRLQTELSRVLVIVNSLRRPLRARPRGCSRAGAAPCRDRARSRA